MEEKNELDWELLKGPIILFCVCLIVAGLLNGWSYYFNSKLKKEFKQNNNNFQSISRRYLDVDQEEKLLHDYYPQFVKYYHQGIIGREKRLNWIEVLRQAGERIDIPSLSYSINSQEKYTPEYNINYNGYALYSSSMELNVGLLHEGDLFKLIDYLNRSAEGTYTLSECTFRRNGREVKFDKNQSNVSASCLMYWITLDLAGDQRIEII